MQKGTENKREKETKKKFRSIATILVQQQSKAPKSLIFKKKKKQKCDDTGKAMFSGPSTQRTYSKKRKKRYGKPMAHTNGGEKKVEKGKAFTRGKTSISFGDSNRSVTATPPANTESLCLFE